MQRAPAWAAALLLCLAACDAQFRGRPFRGSLKWSVILCRFADPGEPPRNLFYYQMFVANLGTGRLSDFYHNVSYGSVDLASSDVVGW
jgi:hypothetical protein